MIMGPIGTGGFRGLQSVITRVISATVSKGRTLLRSGQAQGALTGVVAYDVVNELFNPGETFGETDPQTADGLKKATMAIIQDMEMGGIPLDGLKGRDGQPLPTNYVVMDLEKHRIFPLFKYRSGKSLRSARRRGSWRGFGRARRSYSQNKYIYS